MRRGASLRRRPKAEPVKFTTLVIRQLKDMVNAESHQHDTPTPPRQSKVRISPRMQQARLSSRVQDDASYSFPSVISDIRAFRLYDKDVATFKPAQSNHKVRIKIVAKIAVSGGAHVSENDDRGPHVARADTPNENVQELHRSWEHAIVAR